MSRRTLILALLVLMAMAAPARAAQTIVSVQFDDGRGQAAVRALLARHHVQATFFINTGYVGTPDYFTWSQLHALAADGNEIAGHTLTHRDLASLSAPEQLREICGDRVALVAARARRCPRPPLPAPTAPAPAAARCRARGLPRCALVATAQ
jgi:peptidoglycan/xylan/chitin deacetylase (PgdA/CDA1 family)